MPEPQENAILRKKTFLSTLLSEGRSKYARYNGLPLRYAGGKSLAVGHVIERIPKGVTRLVSPFFGGGSVEIACAQQLGLYVTGYDIFDILVNYWRHQLKSPSALADAIAQWSPTKERYAQVKERLRQHWKGEKLILDSITLAAHYWFNHNLSYGPGFLGWMSKVYQDPMRFERLVDKVRGFRCSRVSVSCSRFEKSIPRHRDRFLYCDPPYFLDGDSTVFRGVYPQRNFPVHHNGFDHKRLRELLYEHQGGFILSYNDCDAIRQWYSDFRIIEVEWPYTLGQGETRIGKNRIETKRYVKRSGELLILSDS